jgi:hypothetical protein
MHYGTPEIDDYLTLEHIVPDLERRLSTSPLQVIPGRFIHLLCFQNGTPDPFHYYPVTFDIEQGANWSVVSSVMLLPKHPASG